MKTANENINDKLDLILDKMKTLYHVITGLTFVPANMVVKQHVPPDQVQVVTQEEIEQRNASIIVPPNPVPAVISGNSVLTGPMKIASVPCNACNSLISWDKRPEQMWPTHVNAQGYQIDDGSCKEYVPKV